MTKPEPELELDRLIEREGAALSRTAALYEHDPIERLDLIQEIWLAIWRALPAYRGDSSLRTYLFRIAHNCGVSHVTRHARRDLPMEHLPDDPDPGPGPDQVTGRMEDAARLESALRRFPLRDRQIVGLKLEGFANREIAEASGLTENNVAVRLTRARSRLRDLLEGSE